MARFRSNGPAFPPNFDQRFLILAAWGFMVPFVWGFNAKWLPAFLGTRPPHDRLFKLLSEFIGGGNCFADSLAFFRGPPQHCLLGASLLAMIALHIFARPEKPAKTKGIHSSFPLFVRSAYVWLLIAAVLGIWADNATDPVGIWGASRSTF